MFISFSTVIEGLELASPDSCYYVLSPRPCALFYEISLFRIFFQLDCKISNRLIDKANAPSFASNMTEPILTLKLLHLGSERVFHSSARPRRSSIFRTMLGHLHCPKILEEGPDHNVFIWSQWWREDIESSQPFL